MPTYRYECQSCRLVFEDMFKVSESDNIPCKDCKGETKKLLFAVGVNFPGDGWATKNGRINAQMRKKNERLDERSREKLHYEIGKKIPSLAPNVNGERTETWSDAQKLAKDKGLSASSYEPLVQKESQKG